MKKSTLTKLPADFILQAGGILWGREKRFLFDVDVLVRRGRILSLLKKGKPLESLVKKKLSPGFISQIRALPKINRKEFFILPALVNSHVHFELSHLKDKITQGQGMASFIKEIINLKQGLPLSEKVKGAIDEAVRSGTLLAGDVSNSLGHINELLRSPLEGLIFHEILGLDPKKSSEFLRIARSKLKEINIQVKKVNEDAGRVRWLANYSAHAPYSLSQPLQKKLSKLLFSSVTGIPSSIHFAESLDELSYLQRKASPISGFYRDLKLPSFDSPITWDEALNLWVKKGQILVHGTYLSENEMPLLKKKGSGIVLCPRSNQFITGGKAPVKLFMKWKLPLALGTDSLASNQDLNLFAEMRSCVDIYRLSPVAVFDFATRNGARLLQRAKDFGIIDRGYLAKWISVPLEIAQNSIPPKTRNINIKHLSIFFTNLLEIPVHPVEEVFY